MFHLVYLHRSVDVHQLQQRLLHLRQELGEEEEHLLGHPWRILREDRSVTVLAHSSPRFCSEAKTGFSTETLTWRQVFLQTVNKQWLLRTKSAVFVKQTILAVKPDL